MQRPMDSKQANRKRYEELFETEAHHKRTVIELDIAYKVHAT